MYYENTTMRNKTKKLLIKYKEILALLFFGIALRITGIKWGFPATLHNDESVLVRSSLGMRFGDLNPHHFDWPSFYFYLNYFVFWVFLKIRVRLQLMFGTELMQQKFPFWWHHETPFYYLSRLLSTFFSVLIIVLVYLIALKVFKNKKIAVLASLIYSFSYYAVYYSRYGLHDTAFAFFLILSVYGSLFILKSGNWKSYAFTAVIAGLATSVKYNGFLACFFILFAHLFRNKNFKSIFSTKLITAGSIAVIFFFIGTPYALLDYKTFLNIESSEGAMWQIAHMGSELNWSYYILNVFPKSIGVGFALFGYFGIYKLIKCGNKFYMLLLSTFLLTLLYVGTWGITRPHYSLPMTPLLSIFSAYGFYIFLENKTRLKKYSTLLILLLLIQPSYYIFKDTYARVNGDTRIVSGKWLDQNIAAETNIGVSSNRTGIFGGDNPVFTWENYKVTDKQNGLVIKHDWSKVLDNGENCKVFKNDWMTGPNISLCYE